MSQMNIPATIRTPEINFDFTENRLSIKGESYPENARTFYQDLLQRLNDHLATLDGASVEVNFDFIYFSSDTTRVLKDLLGNLDAAAQRGLTVAINWNFDEDDDAMEDLGTEFKEQVQHANFEMKPK